jgi:hypothetical protein
LADTAIFGDTVAMNALSPQPNPYDALGQFTFDGLVKLAKYDLAESTGKKLSPVDKFDRGVAFGQVLFGTSVAVGVVIGEVLERIFGPPPMTHQVVYVNRH